MVLSDFHKTNWALLDLKYEYLDDGFKITATTDVPCHLYCRMTKIPPEEHSKPTFRRGIQLPGDVRFCFVVYEDNEQEEAGDTLAHTFLKGSWPVCEHRWFYFVGFIDGTPSVSQSCIFHFHFPAPPPEPPPPITRLFLAQADNRHVWYSWGSWAVTHDTGNGNVSTLYDAPWYAIIAGDSLTASYWIMRGYLAFPTATLPDTARIVSADIYLYAVIIDSTTPARPWLYVTQGVQNLPPISSDYGAQLPYTDILGQAKIASFTLNAYNSVPLNDAGFALIDKTGVTRFCLRGQNDVEDHASVPIYRNYVRFHSQQKGPGYRPYLEVNYYPA